MCITYFHVILRIIKNVSETPYSYLSGCSKDQKRTTICVFTNPPIVVIFLKASYVPVVAHKQINKNINIFFLQNLRIKSKPLYNQTLINLIIIMNETRKVSGQNNYLNWAFQFNMFCNKWIEKTWCLLVYYWYIEWTYIILIISHLQVLNRNAGFHGKNTRELYNP